MNKYWIACFLFFVSTASLAQNILMARAQDNFAATIELARQSLSEHGYTVSHIQRCDGGLKDFGFTTAPYRILFFGKPDEVRRLTSKHPELVPFLPLKMAVFQEDKEVLVVIFNPEELSKLFNDEDLKIQFKRWSNDFMSVLNDVRNR